MSLPLAEIWAQDEAETRRERAETLGAQPSGSIRTTGFGGPASVGGQLEEDSRPKAPAIRFPTIDRFLQPWFDWKPGSMKNTVYNWVWIILRYIRQPATR